MANYHKMYGLKRRDKKLNKKVKKLITPGQVGEA